MSSGTLVAPALAIVGIVGTLVAFALYACGRAVASVAAAELRGWLPHIAAAVIATAVARLPERDRDRYHEEWLGELLAYQDRPVTALIFSVGVRRRVGDVVKELPSSAAPEPPAEYSLSPKVRVAARNADKRLGVTPTVVGYLNVRTGEIMCLDHGRRDTDSTRSPWAPLRPVGKAPSHCGSTAPVICHWCGAWINDESMGYAIAPPHHDYWRRLGRFR